MGKMIDKKVVKFVGYTDLDGKPLNDRISNYLGTVGLLCIFESEKKAPGTRFIYFYPNENELDIQQYFHSSCGRLTQTDDVICLETDHKYAFEVSGDMSELEIETMLMNINYARNN